MEFGNIGVFLCRCGKTLNLDFKKIAKALEGLEEVGVVETVESLCTEEGLAYIVDDIRRKELDKIIVAACPDKNQIFEDIGEQMGLEPLGVDVVDIREGCAWVHPDKNSATQKAKFILLNAVKKDAKLPEIIEVEANPSVLIAGADSKALELADRFADFNIDIHVLSEEPYFRRGHVRKETYNPSNHGSVYEFKDAKFHMNSKIYGITGDVGDFTVDLKKGPYIDRVKCVDCGKCIEACEEQAAIRPVDSASSVYVINETCTKCRACVEVCQTSAVVLEPENESINVGQIISFYPLDSREGVYIVDGAKDWGASYDAALQTALNMKGYKKERFISSDLEKCANRYLMEKKLDMKGCTHCVDSCAYFPVGSGKVSQLSCKGCGSCATACPQNTYTLDTQSFGSLLTEVELIKEADIPQKIVMFACAEGGYSTLKAAGMNQLKYPPALTLFVPCIGNVSELHILRAIDSGASGVVLLGCGSQECMYGKGFARGSSSAATASKILGSFNLGKERVRVLRADSNNPEQLIKQMAEFEGRLKELDKNPLSKKKPAHIGVSGEKKPGKRVILHALISGFSEATGVKEGKIETEQLPIGLLAVNEKECTLCGACAIHCNTGALRFEGKDILDIYNTHTFCVGCRICEEICPEKAITLEKALDIGIFIEKKEIKFNIPIVSCLKCGSPLMAEAALKKLQKKLGEKELDMMQKCQSCLDRETIADILRKDESADDFIIIQQGKAPWER